MVILVYRLAARRNRPLWIGYVRGTPSAARCLWHKISHIAHGSGELEGVVSSWGAVG